MFIFLLLTSIPLSSLLFHLPLCLPLFFPLFYFLYLSPTLCPFLLQPLPTTTSLFLPSPTPSSSSLLLPLPLLFPPLSLFLIAFSYTQLLLYLLLPLPPLTCSSSHLLTSSSSKYFRFYLLLCPLPPNRAQFKCSLQEQLLSRRRVQICFTEIPTGPKPSLPNLSFSFPQPCLLSCHLPLPAHLFFLLLHRAP